jgi:hypothetical protein
MGHDYFSHPGRFPQPSFREMCVEQWNAVIKANLSSASVCAREATRALLRPCERCGRFLKPAQTKEADP